MDTRSVTREASTVVSVLSTVMKVMRDQVTLQRNAEKMVLGPGWHCAAVSNHTCPSVHRSCQLHTAYKSSMTCSSLTSRLLKL